MFFSSLLEADTIFGLSAKVGFQGAHDEFLASPTIFGRLGSSVEYLLNFTGRYAGDIRLGGNLGRLRDSAEDIESGLGKLVWKMTPRDEVNLSFMGFRERGRVPSNPAAVTPDPSAIVERTTQQFTYRLGYSRLDPTNPFFNFAGFVYYTTMDLAETRLSGDRRDDIDSIRLASTCATRCALVILSGITIC